MECVTDDFDISRDNNQEMTLSSVISNTFQDNDTKCLSESVNSSTLDDSEDEDEVSIRIANQTASESDSFTNNSALDHHHGIKTSDDVCDMNIQKKVVSTKEPWFPKMSLLELAYKLKEAEFRVFGSSNGQSNRGTLSERATKEGRSSVTSELDETNHNHSTTIRSQQSDSVSCNSAFPRTFRDLQKAVSNKFSPSGNTNGIKQSKTFVSQDLLSSLTHPNDYGFPSNTGSVQTSSSCGTLADVNITNHETDSYYPTLIKNEPLDTIDLTSAISNRSEHFSRYSKSSYMDERRRHPCSFCPYRSDTRSHLRRHELAIHKNGAKARNRLPRLPEYVMSTTMPMAPILVSGPVVGGRRRHHCDQCMYETNSVCHLRRHQSTIHGKEKPFRCNVCLLEFSRSEKVRKFVL